MIYAVLGALAIGFSLGIFGSGGSILTVPVLIYLLHHPDKVAIAESLGIVGSIAVVGAMPYAKDKLVQWRMVLLFGIPGMMGTYLGAWISSYVEGYIQLMVFAGVMIAAAVMMWQRAKGTIASHLEDNHHPKHPVVFVMLEGVMVGVITGFVGVGGGFMIVPSLVLLCGLSMRQAVGTSLMIIAMNSVIGFAKNLQLLDGSDAKINFETIAIFIVIGVVGSFVGKSMSTKINQRALQKGFAVFLLLMAGFIIAKESKRLLSSSDTQQSIPTMEQEHG